MRKKRLPLHLQIIAGMLLGILFGFLISLFPFGKKLVNDWIAPFGTIFIRLLKLIAIPLIFVSLVKGIAELKDIAKFRRIGLRTVVLYIGTTVIAISIGLIYVNLLKPGVGMSEETVRQLTETYVDSDAIRANVSEAVAQTHSGPLDFLVDMVPDNLFAAMSNNSLMLQIIFFSILFGISMLLIPERLAEPSLSLVISLNGIVLKMVDIIMKMAPLAVFTLLAQIIVNSGNVEILQKLLFYGLTVLLGLLTMILFYILVVYLVTGKSPRWFLRGMAPAQLLGFSTSSSAATLPVTMECVNKNLGVDNEVSSFVLPVGATINMDGTSLYQAVAAVFIAQALHIPLEFTDQLTIVLTALLASIGSAAVPGAGMVMLVIVLESIGIPSEKLAIGLALIFAIDRPLDMCRTVANLTGDSMVALLVEKMVGNKDKSEIADSQPVG